MQALPSNVFAVILAGGSGTRFWPKSRHQLPKQLCKIGDSQYTMIELTLKRLDGLIPPERRLIVTHRDQLALTRQIAGDCCLHFIAEPLAKNTAPALTLAALEIERWAKKIGQDNPLMISLHADALIQNLDLFRSSLHTMCQAANRGLLVLLGIKPELPETAYGYIEKGTPIENLELLSQVQSFREKPDRITAENYLQQGHFLWNSGIFAWQIATILDELRRYVPSNTLLLEALLDRASTKTFEMIPDNEFHTTYNRINAIAIDPAVLERSQKVAVIEADIGWKDIGSWDALDQCFPTDQKGNLFMSDDVVTFDCEGVTIDSDAKIVACIGLKDLVIVSSEGAILVCRKDRAQEVKRVVEALKLKEKYSSLI